KGEWQRVGEGCQDGVQEASFCLTWLLDRVTDVLLVVPALGVLPRHIQPHGRRRRPSPAHRSASRRHIERREVREEGRTCRGEEVPHHVWAEPPCRTHPVIIERSEERRVGKEC